MRSINWLALLGGIAVFWFYATLIIFIDNNNNNCLFKLNIQRVYFFQILDTIARRFIIVFMFYVFNLIPASVCAGYFSAHMCLDNICHETSKCQRVELNCWIFDVKYSACHISIDRRANFACPTRVTCRLSR